VNSTGAVPTSGTSRRAWAAVALAAALLVLRKPWALHTPQLYAEDGSIFLLQNEAVGARALLEPYNGYLHLLPRLIAWLASRTADVAWWPAIYNGLAFAIAVGVFARLASERVRLPGKPWLILAFVVVASTGETLLSVTNLQWIAAFFLVLQLFVTRPAHAGARALDLGLVVLAGLTGPFALVLLPLFAWRAARERNADNLLVLATVLACALVQAGFLARSELQPEHAGDAFRPGMLLAIIGSRLVLWPIAGAAAVRAWPRWSHALLGVAALATLLAWALRRDERRPIRARVVAAFALVTLACLYRARPDTWENDDLVNGDRYFYLSRVLLAWLVIWEFDARPPAVAWLARGVAVLGAVTFAPRFSEPAPPDYHWRAHCDPIRRGTAARIPTLPEGWTLDYPGRTKR